MNYDLKYALRLCSDKRLDKACVHIYSTMGLYSEAVNLALAVSSAYNCCKKEARLCP